jgi:two-component system, sensor histidine kinase and response regulator
MYRILVVENEENIKNNLELLLRTENFHTLSASNGMNALKIMESFTPDLIISDIMMPYVDGIEFYGRVKAAYPNNFISFIFLTDKIEFNSKSLGLELDVDDYIPKPFDFKKLLTSVNNCREKKIEHDEMLKELKNSVTQDFPHELRTPLVSILGNSDFLRTEFDSLSKEEILSCLSSISSSGLRIHERIEKFLLLSSLETDYLQKDRGNNRTHASYKINKNSVSSLLMELAEQNNRAADLSINLSEDTIRISQDYFYFLIAELVENSIKFSERGTKISVRGKSSNELYTLTIKDNGRGMTENEISHIYAFAHLQKDNYPQSGLGFGLYIISKILMLYDGQIAITSTPGKDTIIEINLKSINKKGVIYEMVQ